MAYHRIKTKTLFLKKIPLSEADFLFTLYTEEFGRIRVLGKAIRKANSKLQAGSQIFYLSEIEFIEAKRGKILTDCLVLEKFKNISQNEEKFLKAIEIVNDIDLAFPLEQKDEQAWALILRTFQLLNQVKKENKQALVKIIADFSKKLSFCLGC